MIFTFTLLLVFAVLLIFPGWLWFRSKSTQTAWLLALPVFGITFWIALVVAGIGPQSLSNLIEVLGVVVASVLMPYIKFLVIDRSPTFRSRGLIICYASVTLITLGFRLLMPLIPE